MQEQIRYAWGKSSLGDFIAAVSDVGLLAFEFGENRKAMLSGLESLPSLKGAYRAAAARKSEPKLKRPGRNPFTSGSRH
jgi:hypothetical protein